MAAGCPLFPRREERAMRKLWNRRSFRILKKIHIPMSYLSNTLCIVFFFNFIMVNLKRGTSSLMQQLGKKKLNYEIFGSFLLCILKILAISQLFLKQIRIAYLNSFSRCSVFSTSEEFLIVVEWVKKNNECCTVLQCCTPAI